MCFQRYKAYSDRAYSPSTYSTCHSSGLNGWSCCKPISGESRGGYGRTRAPKCHCTWSFRQIHGYFVEVSCCSCTVIRGVLGDLGVIWLRCFLGTGRPSCRRRLRPSCARLRQEKQYTNTYVNSLLKYIEAGAKLPNIHILSLSCRTGSPTTGGCRFLWKICRRSRRCSRKWVGLLLEQSPVCCQGLCTFSKQPETYVCNAQIVRINSWGILSWLSMQ